VNTEQYQSMEVRTEIRDSCILSWVLQWVNNSDPMIRMTRPELVTHLTH